MPYKKVAKTEAVSPSQAAVSLRIALHERNAQRPKLPVEDVPGHQRPSRIEVSATNGQATMHRQCYREDTNDFSCRARLAGYQLRTELLSRKARG
jgi:hypothetical protein